VLSSKHSFLSITIFNQNQNKMSRKYKEDLLNFFRMIKFKQKNESRVEI